MSNSQRPTPVAEVLANFIIKSRWEDLSDSLIQEGKRSLLNFFGCALGVAQEPVVKTAIDVMHPFSGPDQVTVIGSHLKLDMLGASFVNAISANLLDYDDTHLRTVIHPSAPVAPVVLALAERYRLSSRDALHAFILGAEIECRIGNAVSPHHYARGWHITSTCGVFGAAAACAKLLNLDVSQTIAALGIAAGQSSGLIGNLATAAKNIGVGNAARNGLISAIFAQRGYTAASTAIEGKFGWALAMGDIPAVNEITGELRHRWEFANNTYKPYPAGIVFHAVIEACFDIRRDLNLRAEDVANIVVSGDQLLLDRGDRDVHNERDARVSIQHCAAIVFAIGKAGVHEFSVEIVANPAVAELRKKVTAKLDDKIAPGSCKVVVTATDGRIGTATVIHPKGSLERPMTDHELEKKYRDNVVLGGSANDADQQIAAIWNMDKNEESIIPLMALMTPYLSQRT